MLLEEEKCGCEHDHEEDECCCGHHHEHHEDECCCGHHHDHPEIGEECDCPDCEGHDHDRTISFIDEENGEEYKGLFLFHTDLDGKTIYYCAFGDFDDQDSEITVIPLEANEENRLIPIDIESDPFYGGQQCNSASQIHKRHDDLQHVSRIQTTGTRCNISRRRRVCSCGKRSV